MYCLKHISVMFVSKFLYRHFFYWMILFYYLLVFLFPLGNYFIHSQSSNWDFSFKYYILNHFSISQPWKLTHGKLKYLSICDWIFSGFWYLLSVVLIEAAEMETYTLGRSSQVRAKFLLPPLLHELIFPLNSCVPRNL